MKAHRKKRQYFFWTIQEKIVLTSAHFYQIFTLLFILNIDPQYAMQGFTLMVSEKKIAPHTGTRARNSSFKVREARHQPELNSEKTKCEKILRAGEGGDHRAC